MTLLPHSVTAMSSGQGLVPWKEEIGSKALTALAWQLNPSEAILLLLLLPKDIWLCEHLPCPACSRETQQHGVSAEGHPARLQTHNEPRRGAGTGPGATTGRGCGCTGRFCHHVLPVLRWGRVTPTPELGSPSTIDSSILQLDPS